MNITFTLLKKHHFGLLLEWLQTPHVKARWDKGISWTPELIEEKFGSYVKGYKNEEGVRKPLSAYIIAIDTKPIGYIQLYNAYDFPREDGLTLEGMPKSLAAVDYFIGDSQSIGKGLGSFSLKLFLDDYVFPTYDACFVDPDTANIAAIRAYEKAGFQIIKKVQQGNVTWMLKTR